MWDNDIEQYAAQLLDEACELSEGAFLAFAVLASRLFPPYFEGIGFIREEAESMTVESIKQIETDLAGYRKNGRGRVREWLSSHLRRVVEARLSSMRAARRDLDAAALRQQEIFRKMPVPGLEMAAHFRPARLISGDFFDTIPSGDGS